MLPNRKKRFSALNGFYLDQKPPGTIPKVFMPGIVSTKEYVEFSNTISPNGKEFYFARRINKKDVQMVVRWENEVFTQPEEATFLKVAGGFEPHISLDGSRVYFTRFAPPPSGLANDKNLSPQDMEAQMVNIWVMEKLNSGWREPKYCANGMYVTTSISGTIYTTDIRSASEGICRYRLVNGKYSDREHLQGGVNLPLPGAHPCISPDESYIIFDSKRSENPEDSDLFVSFHNMNGTWGKAFNLGKKINTPASEICAAISPDGKCLFYQSQGDIYWVSTSIIEEFKMKNINKCNTERPTSGGVAANIMEEMKPKVYAIGGIIMGIGSAIIFVVVFSATNLLSQQKENVIIKGPMPKMEFVKIKAGEFLMGLEKSYPQLRDKDKIGHLNSSTSIDNDKPAHMVNVRSFQIMTTELTCEQWNKIMNIQTTNTPADLAKGNVTYNDIMGFIAKLNAYDPEKNYRLPSEAEWEYACWAGSPNDGKSIIPLEQLDRMAWTQRNSGKKVQRVAMKEPNAWGLYDMIGNVWEWCEDEYHDTYTGAPTDGSAWITSMSPEKGVIRGGDCWMELFSCHPSARAWMFRNKNPHFTIGFRLIRDY